MGQVSNDSINSYLIEVVKTHQIPSVSAGILVDGKITWVGSSGYSDLDSQMTASTESLYRVGSVSKVLTATLVLRLVELGVLDLNEPIQTYIPNYPLDRKGAIKVIHLLAHTSGISHYKGNENRSFVHFNNLREASRLFEDRKLKFKPGTKYKYTSYGYTLLGAVIEAATGKSYFDNLKTHILDVAGMNHTFIENKNSPKIQQVKLYKKEDGKIVLDVNNDLSNIYPAGGLLSTPNDLLLFYNAWNSGKLISQKNIDLMVSVIKTDGKVLDENAGLGWNIWEHNSLGWVCHRIGGQSGASALLLSYREQGVTVVLLSNQAVLDPIWEISNTLIGFGRNQKKL
ncbi:serine hydrolase domain-containing protein [Winogradskyella vincentii]|uniref:Beta-lactamase family protein n=1 Tax=Winogradskyella vincentii TaxID=2877122 RepID=A0ABS7XXK1_9FLAO|nr:serine hydrolase domain-containing protein [Winogradskyella vincentii]MCA0152091.1 beta-lactamase family protein [Winogradskyella vincentii]